MKRMTKEMSVLVKRILLCTVGGILVLNALLLSLTANMNVGILIELLLGAVFLFAGICRRFWISKIPRWLRGLFWAGVLVLLGFSAFLLGYGAWDNVTYREDAVIVLGAGIRGETVSLTLKDRLDAALSYYQENPEAVIVVSGGQGPQETIPEALAMERYLLNQGVPKEHILKEEKSTSTYENFVYTKEILDQYFDDAYEAAFVTNEYHVYRAKGIAKEAGFSEIAHTHSGTRLHSLLSGTLRECLAVVKFWALGK